MNHFIHLNSFWRLTKMFQVFARTTGIGAAAAVAAASCLPKYRRSTAAAEQSGVLGEYDVCVIGGGAVGLVRASLLFYLRFFHLSHFYISHLLLFLFLHNSGLCAWNYGTVSIKDRRCLGKGSRRSSTPNQSQLGRTLKFILLLKYKTSQTIGNDIRVVRNAWNLHALVSSLWYAIQMPRPLQLGWKISRDCLVNSH